MAEPTSYIDDNGNIVDTISDNTNSLYDTNSMDDMLDALLDDKEFNLERAAELKRKNLYRKTGKPLQYDSDGTLETDSDLEIRAKEGINAISKAADWILESTTNIADFGQGKLLDNAQVDAVINGKNVNMSNKDILAARNTTLENLIEEYNNAEYDPNADKAVYTLRKFDGYNQDGTPKYIYKHGLAEVSAADRYRNQWIEDGFEIVDEKRFIGAEKWENTLHALDESLAERTLDYGGVKDENGNWTSTDKASGVDFGSGYTELYNKNLLGMNDPTKQQFAENKALSEMLMKNRDETRISGSNFIDALQSGLITTAAGIGDFALDAITPGDNTFLNKWADSEWADKFVGYDRTETNQAMEEALADVKSGDIFSALGRVKDFGPEVFAESIPFMATMWFGAGEAQLASKAAKIYGAIDKAKRAGKSAKYIKSLRGKASNIIGKPAMEKYAIYENAPKLINEMRALSKNTGLLAINGLQTNQAIDKRVKSLIENGEDPDVSVGEALSIYAFQLPFTMLDKIALGDTVAGKGAMKLLDGGKNTLKKSISILPENKAIEIGKKILSTGAKVLAGAGEEATQEYFQTWGEVLSAKVGINGQTLFDVLSDEESQHQAELGAVGGFGAGGVPSIIGATAGKTLSALNQKRIDKINKENESKDISNEPLKAIGAWDEISPSGTTIEDVQSHMDASISKLVPFVDVEPDGTYNKENVLDEILNLHKKIISPIRNHVAQTFANEDSSKKPDKSFVKDMHLGSSKVAINRIKNSIKKLTKSDLSPDEEKMIENTWVEIRDFEDAIDSLFKEKIKDYSIEEINDMTHDKLVLEFGAEATTETDNGSKFEDPDEFTEDDNPESIKNKLEEDAVEGLKEAIISEKIGDDLGVKNAKKKIIRKKKLIQTIDSITENVLFEEDKGLIWRAANLRNKIDGKEDIEESKAKVLDITKQWIVDNDESIQSKDEVTDKILEEFFAKGQTKWNRGEYYSNLNSNGIKSIFDHNKVLESIDNGIKKLKSDIDNKLSSKKSKHEALFKATENISDEIETRFQELKTNGIPEDSTKRKIRKLGEEKSKEKIIITNPTDEEVIKQLRKEYQLKKSKVDGVQFEINYRDVLSNMLDGDKEDYKKEGIIKLLDAIDNEILSLESFVVNSDGTIDLSGEQKQQQQNYEKKQKEKLNDEIRKITGKDIQVLSKKEIDDTRKEISKLEDRLSMVQKDINDIYTESKDTGDITVFQEKVIAEIAKSDTVAAELYKKYLQLKNKLKKGRKESNILNKELDKINNEMRKLKDERDNLVKEVEDAHKNKTLHKSLDKKTWIERAKIIMKGLTNKISGLLNGYRTKVKEIDSKTKELYKLVEQKNKIEADKKIIDSKNVRTKVAKNDAKTEFDTKAKTLIAEELDNTEEKRTKVSKRFEKFIQEKIKTLKKKLETPVLTLQMLVDQASSIPKNNLYAESGVPNVIADYATANSVAGSLFSLMTPTSLGNKILNKYVNKAVQYYKSAGLDAIIKREKKFGNLSNDYPIYALLVNKDGKVNQSVLTAVILAAEEAIRNKAGMLYSKTDSEIARMLGTTESSLTAKQKSFFRQMTRRANLANEIGNSIMQTLDLKMKEDGDIEAFERLKTSAGLLGLEYLINTDRIETQDISSEEYAKLINEENKITDDAKVTFVTLKKDKKGKIQPINKEELEKLRLDFEELEESSLIPRAQSTVQFKKGRPLTAEERKIKGNPFMQPTEIMAEALNKSEAQEHNLLTDVANILFDESKYTREEALKLMGWIPEEDIKENKDLLYDTKEARIAANMEKERAYDELKLLHDSIKENRKPNTLFFKYFSPRNNRLNIDSVLIDPQTEKELHRWLITPTVSERNYSIKDIMNNNMNAIGFKFGIAQAFGNDIDKDSVADTIKYADKLLAMSSKELTELIKSNNIDHLGHALQAYNAIGEYRKAKEKIHYKTVNGKKIYKDVKFKSTITAEYDGITNGTILKILQISAAANAAEILFKGGFVFEDVDNSGVSNDMAKKYQRGVEYNKFVGMLKEIGLSAKERANIEQAIKDGKDIKDMPSGSVLDVYYTQALAAELQKEKVIDRIEEAMNSKFNKLKDKYGLLDNDLMMHFIPKAEGNLSKELREMFKFPTMMINYGSSVFTVINNVANDAVEEMFLKILSDYNADINSVKDNEKKKKLIEDKKIATTLLNKIVDVHSGQNKDVVDSNVNSVEELIEMLQTKPLSQIGSWHKTKNNKKYMSNIQDDLVDFFKVATGSAVGAAIKDTFGEAIDTTEVINTNSRYMFRVFEQVLEQDINDFIKSEKKNNNGVVKISREKLNEFIMNNKKFLPIMEGPASEDRIKDGIAIFTNKAAPSSDLQYGKHLPRIAFIGKDGKEHKMSARTFVNQISEAFSAAGVLPTHTEDAVDMSKFVNGVMEDYGVTHVHDAIVIAGEDVNKLLQFMNKGIGETSRGYSMIVNFARAMREVHSNALMSDKNINLKDMHSDTEKKKLVDKAKKSNTEYEPADYLTELIKMEDLGEKIWIKKERLFSHNVKVDQIPGPDSMHTMKAKYDRKSHAIELANRYANRMMSNGISPDKIQINKMIKEMDAVLKQGTKDIKNQTEKINKSLDIIESITKILNGDC